MTPLALLLLGPAHAGDWVPLAEKVAQATQAFVVRYPVTGAIPKSWPNTTWDPRGWGFPDALSDAARAAATIERVVRDDGRGAPVAAQLDPGFTSGGACWWKAHARGGLRVLVLTDRGGPGATARTIFGVEADQGLLTELNPRFDALVAAVEEAFDWRARSADPSWDWAGPEQAAASTDPERRLLAYGAAARAEETSPEAAALASSMRGARATDGTWPAMRELGAVEDRAAWCKAK